MTDNNSTSSLTTPTTHTLTEEEFKLYMKLLEILNYCDNNINTLREKVYSQPNSQNITEPKPKKGKGNGNGKGNESNGNESNGNESNGNEDNKNESKGKGKGKGNGNEDNRNKGKGKGKGKQQNTHKYRDWCNYGYDCNRKNCWYNHEGKYLCDKNYDNEHSCDLNHYNYSDNK